MRAALRSSGCVCAVSAFTSFAPSAEKSKAGWLIIYRIDAPELRLEKLEL